MSKHLQGLSRQYQSVLSKVNNIQHTLNTQDTVMQNIIQYLANPEPARELFLPAAQSQKFISSYDEATKASVDIMNDISQLGAQIGHNTTIPPQTSGPGTIPQPHP